MEVLDIVLLLTQHNENFIVCDRSFASSVDFDIDFLSCQKIVLMGEKRSHIPALPIVFWAQILLLISIKVAQETIHQCTASPSDVTMLAIINRILDWFKSLFWKEEMELTLVGLQYSGKTTFVNVIAVSKGWLNILYYTLCRCANAYVHKKRFVKHINYKSHPLPRDVIIQINFKCVCIVRQSSFRNIVFGLHRIYSRLVR